MSIKKTDMQKLSAMTDLAKMKDFAVDMLQSSRTDARKKSRLVNDVQKYNRPDKVLRLMWNAFLSGEGKGTIGSRYSKAMAEEVDLVEYFDTMNATTFASVINESNSAIGKTIMNQIKTIDKVAMTAWGAKDIVYMDDGLKFKTSGMARWKGYVYIHYNKRSDLYDVEFAKIRKLDWKREKMIEGVMVEDLVRIINEKVGR